MGLNIGPEALETFVEEIEKNSTIVFDRLMGMFEMSSFLTGIVKVTELLAKAME